MRTRGMIGVLIFIVVGGVMIAATAQEKLYSTFVLEPLVSTWDPGQPSLLTRAMVKSVEPELHFFTDARAGYQICMKNFRLAREAKGWNSPAILFPNGSMLVVSRDPANAIYLWGFRVYGRGLFVPKESALVNDLFSVDASHVYNGTVELLGHRFESDPSFPLVFKVKQKGYIYVYLCGRGTVWTKDGQAHRFGQDTTVDTALPLLKSDNQLEREGAAQALGWISKTDKEIDKAVPALIEVLKDQSIEVRRNAAESLGSIGDVRAVDALRTLTDKEKEGIWVSEVAEESLGLISVKNSALKLPDKAALAILTEGLNNKWALVRRTAAELLAKGGADALEPLIGTLKDEDSAVRQNSAKSLGKIGDRRTLEALKEALDKEQDVEVKMTMEQTIKALEK